MAKRRKSNKIRTTYRAEYNQNHGYMASRKVQSGRYKGHIIVLYDNRDGVQFDKNMGKYIFVNETLSKIGFSVDTQKQAYEDLKSFADGSMDYQF